MLNKTKIEWCDVTWNPVTGCLHKCVYCYARKTASRFAAKNIRNSGSTNKYVLDKPARSGSGKKEPYPFGFFPTYHRYRLDEPQDSQNPLTIFVCSMADLFGLWVPDEWIEEVFAACKKAPQHRYLFLTKNPARYILLAQAGKLPERDNFWFGSTATNSRMPFFFADQYHTFVSCEPIEGPILTGDSSSTEPVDINVDWLILGAETGNRKGKIVPRHEWFRQTVEDFQKIGKPVFMKDSLIPIVGEENMLRQLPW